MHILEEFILSSSANIERLQEKSEGQDMELLLLKKQLEQLEQEVRNLRKNINVLEPKRKRWWHLGK